MYVNKGERKIDLRRHIKWRVIIYIYMQTLQVYAVSLYTV